MLGQAFLFMFTSYEFRSSPIYMCMCNRKILVTYSRRNQEELMKKSMKNTLDFCNITETGKPKREWVLNSLKYIVAEKYKYENKNKSKSEACGQKKLTCCSAPISMLSVKTLMAGLAADTIAATSIMRSQMTGCPFRYSHDFSATLRAIDWPRLSSFPLPWKKLI